MMVRHGETEDNIKKIYSRDSTVLTPRGIEQIKNTKLNVKELNFSKVYYSPLVRTKETLNYLGLEGIEEKRIREINFGIFAGLDYKTISEKYSYETEKWISNPMDYRIPEGENLKMVYKRVSEFLEELVKQDEDVLLVVHDGIIRLVCCWVFNNIDYFFKFKVDNGSINIITIMDGYKYISKLNYNPDCYSLDR